VADALANIEAIPGGMHEIERRGPDRAVFADFYKPALTEAMRQWFAEIHRRHPAPADRVISFN
jgi:hypothetical protein